MKPRWRLLILATLIPIVAWQCENADRVTDTGSNPPPDGTASSADSLVLARDFPPMLANGLDRITIRATVVDENGKGLSGVGVAFNASHGTIEPFATTGTGGSASTTLTSERSAIDLISIISATTATGKTAGDLPPGTFVIVSRQPLNQGLIEKARTQRGGFRSTADPASGAIVGDTAEILMKGITLTVEPHPAVLPADGISRSSVVATLKETTSRIPLADQAIQFGATSGIITGRATTGDLGQATAVFTARPGDTSSRITAYYGDGLTAVAEVQFSPLSLSCEAAGNILLADGTSSLGITARLLNQERNPVVGAAIDFSSTRGSIVSPVQTDAKGEAVTTLIASSLPGTAEITARFGGVLIATTEVVLVAPPAAPLLALRAEPPSIPADGITTTIITATLTDPFGRPVAAGTVVEFATSLGTLDSPTPTDATGAARVRLRSERFRTGTALVTARTAASQNILQVYFVSRGAAQIEAIRVDPPRIGIRGASEHTSSTITFEVQDADGIPVDSNHTASLGFSVVPQGGSTDATLGSSSAVTNDRGLAAATLQSGTISGVVEVRAAVGAVESRPIRVAIHGDLPDPAHFSVFVEKVNVAGLVYSGILDHVTAKVGDQHGNCVPESTAVWFSCDYGVVQGSAFTGDICDATVLAETAGPWPQIPGGDGLVRICAQTVSKAGARIETCTNVLWSGRTIVEFTSPGGFDVPNGGSVTLSYRVRDANFNPLTGGTSIDVATTGGRLGGDTGLVLPDTQSRDYTEFQVVLSDDDADTDRPAAVTVTVAVQSQNGPGSASITGVMN